MHEILNTLKDLEVKLPKKELYFDFDRDLKSGNCVYFIEEPRLEADEDEEYNDRLKEEVKI